MAQDRTGIRRCLLAMVTATALLCAGTAHAQVASLSVQDTANAADWSVQSNLQVGSTQYGDRVFTFTAVPASVAGAQWIRTANDSKAFIGATLVSFILSSDADVYVAHNDSITPKPSWLSGWIDTGANLVNNEGTPRTFSLFRRSFTGGTTVSLGNNGSTGSGMYTVAVKTVEIPLPTPTRTPTPTPTVPPVGDVKLTIVGATASTSDTNVPANAIDGNLATRWSANGDPQWLLLDLGVVQTVSALKVAAHMGNTRANIFDIQVGDGVGAFVTVVAGARTSGATTALETFDIADQPARLVRYVGHGNSDPTKPTWNSVAEVEVWGGGCTSCPTPTVTPTRTPTPTPTPTPTGVTPTPTPTSRPQPNGNPVLPPKWAFGVLYGSYYNQAQILDAMSRIRAEYSGDVLWVDSSWLSNEYNDAPKYINFKFDPGQFPNPGQMISTLHANHFRFGVWEWPYIDTSNSLYATGRNNNYFIRNSSGAVVDGGGWHGVTFTGQIDFTNPAAANWFKQLNQPVLNLGVDFFKIDTYGTVADGGVLFSGGSSDSTYREAYHKTVFELTQAAQGSQGRGLIFAHRQSSPNNHRYPGLWTGDIASTWAGFQTAIDRSKAMNTMTTTGYWAGDTGGYNSGNPTDELYMRWLQFGAFSPVNTFFSEKPSKTRFPWVFGSQAQQVFKQYTMLRYRLLPFRYSNAQVAYHETPVQWPVTFPSGTTNQMILGSGSTQMMVAMVTTAGATSRSVTFPAGASWINYWTGTVQAGGTSATVASPLTQVPLFVRAGSIVPMGPEIHWVDEKPADPLTLDTYPSGASSYTLYEDDGMSLGYQGGAVSRTTFTCDATSGITFTVGASSGHYAGKLANRTYILKVNKRATGPGAVTRDGATMTSHGSQAAFEAASEGWYYDATADIVWVKFRTSTTVSTQVRF